MFNPVTQNLQRKPVHIHESGVRNDNAWLALVSTVSENSSTLDEGSALRLENARLQHEVEALTKKLEAANQDLLWRDTLAARHADAYAKAEQQTLHNSPG